MSSSADLPSRTSSASQFEDLQQRVHQSASPACVTSARLTRFVVQRRPYLTRLPQRYLRHAFIGASIPLALLAGTILPAARPQSVAIQPIAAAYAAQSAVVAAQGDLPMAQTDVAAAFADRSDDGDAVVRDEIALSLGHPVQSPVMLGSVTEDNVNLRRGASTSEAVLAKIPQGTRLEVIGQRPGWYKVATAKGAVGWVVDDYFSVKSASKGAARTITAAVGQSSVNLRQGPGTSYGSYGKMAEGTPVQVLARNGNWFKVRSPRGTIGWVARDLISVSDEIVRNVPVTQDVPPAPKPQPVAVKPVPNVIPAQPSAPAAPVSADAAGLARQYVGARYIWGGASPSGFDCSGLTLYVYKQLGLNLPHKASLQYTTPGQRIGSLDALAPGDLVFFVRTTPAKGITHVGIYTGNGRMVTAGTERTGVQEVSVYSQYWASRFAGGVRPSR